MQADRKKWSLALRSTASLIAVVLVLAPAARARVLHTVVQDDTQALFAPQRLESFVGTLRWLGVDYLRVSAKWQIEAPNGNSVRVPRGLRPSDPSSYDSLGMRLLDRAVRVAKSAGLHVMIDPAFSAPLWATGDARSRTAAREHWHNTDINLRQLVAWEVMLARRYSGDYTPPGQAAPLPRVDAFTLWNEPNGGGYLKPQWRDGVPVSADWYRQLVQLAYPAIKRVSPEVTILIGNTSNIGTDAETSGAGVAPLTFIERLACVNSRLQPVHDGACADFREVPGDGFAHHPYERGAPPWQPSAPSQRGWVQMGDLPKLQSLLDKLVAMHRLAPGARKLWLTEQGYESNGELRDRPWSEAQQATLDAESEYLAARDPQVQSFSQFLLRDTLTDETLALRRRRHDPHTELPGTWASGLEREHGAPKPAFPMFRSPVVARLQSRTGALCLVPRLSRRPSLAHAELIEVWGRARPVVSPTVVQIQARVGNAAQFVTAMGSTTDGNGIFDVMFAVPDDSPVAIRFQWRADRRWQRSPVTDPVRIPVAGAPG